MANMEDGMFYGGNPQLAVVLVVLMEWVLSSGKPTLHMQEPLSYTRPAMSSFHTLLVINLLLQGEDIL